jgi:hypothetical protein
MKKFLFKSVFLATVITLSTIGIKYLLPFEKNYNSAMVDKLGILQKNKAKQKIILIGGSSVGWGLSAEKIQKATNITTINLGHHAGFGLLDYQEFIISCLNPNDIIIFSPEWNFYDKPDDYDTATLDDLYTNTTYLKITKKSLFTKIKSTLLRKISLSTNKNHDPDNPYVYNCFNKNGDVISHCGIKSRKPNKYKVDFAHFDLELFKAKFKYISKARCILLFPPTQESVYKMYKKSFDDLQMAISISKLGYIDLIPSNVYNETDFFDAEYHLKCEIKNKRTEKVIKSIISLINFSKSNHTHQGSN